MEITMKFQDIKAKLISLFEQKKLDGKMGTEWGFNNEIDRNVKRIGYSVNLTPETIEEAVKYNVDFIITHHDAWFFVFGMKEQCQLLLKENNIAHAFFHSPLDDADFGTSSSLANALNLKNCNKAVPYEEVYFMGVIGELDNQVDFEQFSEKLSDILGEPIRAFKNNKNPVSKICVVTGAGNMSNDIKAAVDSGCDTYITGEYGLYSQQYSKFAGINLMIGSHTNTEIFGVAQLVKILTENTNVEIVRLPEENY
ncbi:MAG: Nif3-like dinuclear metal center hexameric protein [Oscillospiraceae bacterium]|nr:Nif3-like dinuclear metal center hexameric protein [Oscillospiraceae bacterium]